MSCLYVIVYKINIFYIKNIHLYKNFNIFEVLMKFKTSAVAAHIRSEPQIFLEAQLLTNFIDVTESLRPSFTHGTFSYFVHLSVVCGPISMFFTVLQPRI